MTYIRPAQAVTNAMLTAQQWNQYIVANFTEGVPGQVAAKGDLITGAGQDRATRIPMMSGGYRSYRGLRVNSAGVAVWDEPRYWRWAATVPYELSPGGDHKPIPMGPGSYVGITPTVEGNSCYITLPEDGTYEFILSLLPLTGIGGVLANQTIQGYVAVDETDYQMCRWTADAASGGYMSNLLNGIRVIPKLVAGQVIRFKVRNEMTARITSGYGCVRRVR